MPRLPHSLLVAGMLSLGVGAAAQPPGPPPPGPGALPHNRAAMRAPAPRQPVLRAELKTALEARFDAMDANHDGTLDGQDRTARRDERVNIAFQRLDSDGNGAISKGEFAAAPRAAGGPPRRRAAR